MGGPVLDSTALLVAPQVGRNMGPSNFGLLFMATSMRESNAASLAHSLAVFPSPTLCALPFLPVERPSRTLTLEFCSWGWAEGFQRSWGCCKGKWPRLPWPTRLPGSCRSSSLPSPSSTPRSTRSPSSSTAGPMLPSVVSAFFLPLSFVLEFGAVVVREFLGSSCVHLRNWRIGNWIRAEKVWKKGRLRWL